jgi:hypothetical protein
MIDLVRSVHAVDFTISSRESNLIVRVELLMKKRILKNDSRPERKLFREMMGTW